jgi:hypothetical protein
LASQIDAVIGIERHLAGDATHLRARARWAASSVSSSSMIANSSAGFSSVVSLAMAR